jgi:hypothetical protein
MWLLSLSVLLQTITKKCFQNSRSDSRPRLPAGLRIRYFDFKVLGPASIGGISHLFLSQLWNSTSVRALKTEARRTFWRLNTPTRGTIRHEYCRFIAPLEPLQ